METFLLLLKGAGYVISFAGGVWLFTLIYEDSMIGGILSLFCGCAALVYGMRQWPESKVPLLLILAGNVMVGGIEAVETRDQYEYELVEMSEFEDFEGFEELTSEEITMDDLEGRPAETSAGSFDDIPSESTSGSSDPASAWETNDAFSTAQPETPPDDPFGTKPTPTPMDLGFSPQEATLDPKAAALEPAERLIETAKIMWEQGRYEAALASAEKALAIYERNLPPDAQEIRNVQGMIDAAKAQINNQ